MELVIKLPKVFEFLLHLLVRPDQEGDAEVVGALPLLEATARHQHNPCVFEHLHAVEQVGLSIGGLDHCLRELHRWESVHGAFYLLAAHILHGV